MKPLIVTILVLAGLAGTIYGIDRYLTPNDFRRCQPEPTADCVKADAIIAISGGDTVARTQQAIDLYKNGWADTLIFSGAAHDKTGPSNAAAMRQQAVQAGVPDAAVLIEEDAETTKQNAEQTRALLESKDISSVILVTSAYHQRRAALEFGQRLGPGFTVRNYPVAGDSQWSDAWWLTARGWWLAISELVKIGVFYLGGSR